MKSKFRALRELSYLPTTNVFQKDFQAQVHAETNDRGACLLLAANLENALDEAIMSLLPLAKERQRAIPNFLITPYICSATPAVAGGSLGKAVGLRMWLHKGFLKPPFRAPPPLSLLNSSHANFTPPPPHATTTP